MDCLFCGSSTNSVDMLSGRLVYEMDCPQCGLYQMTHKIHIGLMKDQYAHYKHLMAGVIREKNELGIEMDVISTENILNIINDPLVPKTIGQKLDKILLYYYRKSNVYGQWLTVDEKTPSSIGYALNHEELLNMVQALIDIGMFKLITHGGQMKQFTITLSGISRAEDLLTTNIYSSKVFVAMGFHDDLLEAHKEAIQPACEECNFKAFLIPEIEHNDDITDKIIAEIKTSKFVITDFTYNNQGAYFEAGYAQGRGLPVIRTCNKQWFDERDESGNMKNHLHFDVNHYNFILWEDYEDLKEKLINRIKATII